MQAFKPHFKKVFRNDLILYQKPEKHFFFSITEDAKCFLTYTERTAGLKKNPSYLHLEIEGYCAD